MYLLMLIANIHFIKINSLLHIYLKYNCSCLNEDSDPDMPASIGNNKHLFVESTPIQNQCENSS